MFVSDQVIFLQLQKTAGTHIAAILSRYLDGKMIGKHGSLDFDPGERLVLGSVRNPWDWYVSLWSYGCGEAGGVQGLLQSSRLQTASRLVTSSWRSPQKWSNAIYDLGAHNRRDPDFWKFVYEDSDDPERFRLWLKKLLGPDGRNLLGADYAKRPLSHFAGFYTYRFLSLFTRASDWNVHGNDIQNASDVRSFFDQFNVVDHLIRNEFLEEDLAEVFAKIGRPDITPDQLRGKRVNASRRQKANFYYDAETAALVAETDPFIIAKFAYSAPGPDVR